MDIAHYRKRVAKLEDVWLVLLVISPATGYADKLLDYPLDKGAAQRLLILEVVQQHFAVQAV